MDSSERRIVNRQRWFPSRIPLAGSSRTTTKETESEARTQASQPQLQSRIPLPGSNRSSSVPRSASSMSGRFIPKSKIPDVPEKATQSSRLPEGMIQFKSSEPTMKLPLFQMAPAGTYYHAPRRIEGWVRSKSLPEQGSENETENSSTETTPSDAEQSVEEIVKLRPNALYVGGYSLEY